MVKHFANLPEVLEKYNPEALRREDFPFEETRDENGLYHSFNDQPAKISSDEDGHVFTWYIHGLVSREGNKPSIITAGEASYSTYNDKFLRHSFNDSPAEMNSYSNGEYFYFNWFKNGIFHRENDLPACFVWAEDSRKEVTETLEYFLDGASHRGMGKPAYVSEDIEKWIVFGGFHNRDKDGYGSEGYDSDGVPFGWRALYGVALPEKEFDKIQTLSSSRNLPLWVSFLRITNFIDEVTFKQFEGEDSEWDYALPLDWQLRALGITNSIFEANIHLRFPSRSGYGFVTHLTEYSTYLEIFTKIVALEEDEAKRVKNHA